MKKMSVKFVVIVVIIEVIFVLVLVLLLIVECVKFVDDGIVWKNEFSSLVVFRVKSFWLGSILVFLFFSFSVLVIFNDFIILMIVMVIVVGIIMWIFVVEKVGSWNFGKFRGILFISFKFNFFRCKVVVKMVFKIFIIKVEGILGVRCLMVSISIILFV